MKINLKTRFIIQRNRETCCPIENCSCRLLRTTHKMISAPAASERLSALSAHCSISTKQSSSLQVVGNNPQYKQGSVSLSACSAAFNSLRRRITFLISRHITAVHDLWIREGFWRNLLKHCNAFYISVSQSWHALTAAEFYKIEQQPGDGFGIPAYLRSVWHNRKQFLRSHGRCVLFLPVNGDREVPPGDCVLVVIFPLL